MKRPITIGGTEPKRVSVLLDRQHYDYLLARAIRMKKPISKVLKLVVAESRHMRMPQNRGG